MRKLEKSEESVLKTAINNTASRAQKMLARQANRVYGGEAPQGILGRSSIRKSTVSNLGATIFFRSTQPDITKHRVSAFGQNPTPIAYKDGQRLKFPISVQQLKNEPLKESRNEYGLAFAIRVKNGKLLIVKHTGEKTNTELLTKKKGGGNANVCYIRGFNPSWNIHLHPCGIMLHDLQGKEIAATTSNSGGCP